MKRWTAQQVAAAAGASLIAAPPQPGGTSPTDPVGAPVVDDPAVPQAA